MLEKRGRRLLLTAYIGNDNDSRATSANHSADTNRIALKKAYGIYRLDTGFKISGLYIISIIEHMQAHEFWMSVTMNGNRNTLLSDLFISESEMETIPLRA